MGVDAACKEEEEEAVVVVVVEVIQVVVVILAIEELRAEGCFERRRLRPLGLINLCSVVAVIWAD